MMHHWPKGASYLVLHSSLFRPDGAVYYDYIATNSIKSLLISSKYILNDPNTNHCWVNIAHTSKCIKNSDAHVQRQIV